MSPTSLVAYLVLFAAVAFLFLLVALLLGRLLRADMPTAEKMEPYECGEPPVGSAYVQFDLRFYVVALVFLIFEVEVTLFFPPATIFGKATQLMTPAAIEKADPSIAVDLKVANQGEAWGTESMYPEPAVTAADARSLAVASMIDLGTFFAVILLGFAYVWYRGDLDWVRATGSPLLKVQG